MMTAMGIGLVKRSLDIGIVVRDAEASLGFYRDVLGLDHLGTIEMPGGASMDQLACGESVIKLLRLLETPSASNPPGGSAAATGFRYFTMIVDDLDDVIHRCNEAAARTALGPVEFMPGVRLVIIEDPDGNWVEFVHRAAEIA